MDRRHGRGGGRGHRHPRALTDFVNSLGGERNDIDRDPGSRLLQIKSGRAQANINGTGATEFPPIPTVEEATVTRAEPETLRGAIARVAFAAAGFRLTVQHGELTHPVQDETRVIVPARTMNELNRLLGDHD